MTTDQAWDGQSAESEDLAERTATLEAMGSAGKQVRQDAVETALNRLAEHDDIDEATEAELRDLSRRLVGKLLAGPMLQVLCAGRDEKASVALDLFGRQQRDETAHTASESPASESGVSQHRVRTEQ